MTHERRPSAPFDLAPPHRDDIALGQLAARLDVLVWLQSASVCLQILLLATVTFFGVCLVWSR